MEASGKAETFTTLAKVALSLNLRARKRRGVGAVALPPLILVTDEDRLPEPLGTAARLPKGSALILRHRDRRRRRALALRLSGLCRERGLVLLVADDPTLAHDVDAGLHLSERRLLGPVHRGTGGPARQRGRLLTAAAHSMRALVLAARRGVGAVLLSPVFETASHPGRRPLGPCRFAALARRSPVPVYALGGLTGSTARRIQATEAVGIAALGAFMGRSARLSRPPSRRSLR
ncbi:MAG: thiamine phosphate synthase [Alphaproteobacteria bacterium]